MKRNLLQQSEEYYFAIKPNNNRETTIHVQLHMEL